MVAGDGNDIATRAAAMREREIEWRQMVTANSSISAVFGAQWLEEPRGMAVYVFQM